jgi:hypothetical protein
VVWGCTSASARGGRSAGPRTDTWLGLPTDRLRDVALSYVLVAPLFLIASLWEFFLG